MNTTIAVNAFSTGERIAVLPEWWKFLIILAVTVELMATGFFLRRKWLETHDVVPLAGALSMWFAMSALYMLVASALYWSSGRAERGPLLFWLFVLFIPLCLQYAANIAHSLSGLFAHRVSPMGVQIPEAPSVGEARRHMRVGNVEAALQSLVDSLDSRSEALAELARLLKSEDRYDEAVPVYAEIIRDCREDRLLWSEAVYNLGKLFETHMNAPKQAAALYRQLIDEAPDSRYCHLAGSDLARLQMMDKDFVAVLHQGDDYLAAVDPFYPVRGESTREAKRAAAQTNTTKTGERKTKPKKPASGKKATGQISRARKVKAKKSASTKGRDGQAISSVSGEGANGPSTVE